MDNIFFKKIEKIILIIVAPIAIFLLVFFLEKPQISVAYLLGVLLAVYRLKTLFDCIGGFLGADMSVNNLYLFKYIFSMLVSLGIIGFVLYKSMIIGVALTLGIISVPIIIMFYAIWQGIKLYREK